MLVAQKYYRHNFKPSGKFTHGEGIATASFDTTLARHIIADDLWILQVSYEIDADNENESSLKYKGEVRNVLQYRTKQPTVDFLYDLVKSSMQLIEEKLSLDCNMTSMKMPPLKTPSEEKIKLVLQEEIERNFPQPSK